MASPAKRRPENVPGPVFVDTTCIDCGTCMWMQPEVFHEDGGMSAVHAQPEGPAARRRALQAVLACPTGSIGTDPVDPELQVAQRDFPVPVDRAPGVYHAGFHSRSSFGAASWFVEGPEGNVLVDSPRFAGPLVRRLEEMGGVDWMVLSHRDDVADHDRFAEHFGLQRVIHAGDADAVPEAEVILEGDVGQVAGLDWMHVPGHTRGHAVYRYDDVLFTGDHLAWSPRHDHLIAFRRACWHSWDEQVRSMERLAAWSFSRVLPGHGRPAHLPADAMAKSMQACIRWMRQAA